MIASISVAALFLGLFMWNIKKGQYDDEISPPVRILFEDKPLPDLLNDSEINSVSNQNCK